MKFTKTIDLNIGDTIEVLTADGWEYGEITDFIENKIKVSIKSFGTNKLYDLKHVKFF